MDELVLVLGQLSAEELLLVCRLVCRRWRDAALHPDLWRRRELCDYRVEQRAVMAAALRHPLRVRQLTVSSR